MNVPVEIKKLADENIARAHSELDQRISRYSRNLNRYMNSQTGRDDITSLYDVGVSGDWIKTALDIDTYSAVNGLKGFIDTLVSKMSQAEVLPRFSPVDGSFFTRKTCRNAQKFFDIFYDEKKVYRKMPLAFRDALLFDFGVMHVDEEDMDIKRVPTYEYFCDPYEMASDKFSFVFRQQEKVTDREIERRFPKYTNARRTNRLQTYYDLINGYKLYYINNSLHEAACIKIEYDKSPFVILYFNESVKGFFTSTLCDDLYPLQCRIDENELYIKSASRKASKHTIIAPKSAKIKWSKLSNDTMEIWEHAGMSGEPNGGISFATPDPLSPMYVQFSDRYLMQMSKISGVSVEAAMSHIQSNIKSNVMLQTSNDMQSERFNVALKNYQGAYLDCAKVSAYVFPKGQKLIEDETTKWGDIVSEQKKFKMQFTGGSVLSKDPQTRREELNYYMSSGLIDPQQASEMLQLPDTYRLDDIVNAAGNYCEAIIERVLMAKDDAGAQLAMEDWSPVVKLDLLLSKTVRYRMEMDTNGEDKIYLKRLDMLYKTVVARMDAAKEASNPPPPPIPEEPPSITTNFKDMPMEAQQKFLAGYGLMQIPVTPPEIPAENIPSAPSAIGGIQNA